jgi:16S rRNA (uracil1498-N3)-methyltransferase
MTRRIHTPLVHPGSIALTPEQAHHARKVLRLSDGETVELFDDAGHVADGTLQFNGASDASVEVNEITTPDIQGLSLTIASAIPKGERSDWMIEKLSELGVSAFIPLAAARSVVLPEGRNKLDRWARIATESAKQSRRAGTMSIGTLTTLEAAMQQIQGTGWVCSTMPGTTPIRELSRNLPKALTLFIGPEGGWTEEELTAFSHAKIVSVRLTDTVLRVETAGVAGAAILLSIGIGGAT